MILKQMNKKISEIVILSTFFCISCFAQESNIALYEVIKQAWDKQDGYMCIVINKAIAEVLLLDTENCITWFAANPEVFKNFINTAQDRTFTDYSGKRKDEIIILKTNLIKVLSLKLAENDDEAETEMIKELLRLFEKIEIREID